MALWHLLVLICFGLPIGCSLAAAESAAAGARYALAVTIGIIVGCCCAWRMCATHKAAVIGIRPIQ